MTLFCLRRLLRTKRTAPAFSPVSGSLLYVAASCLPYHISGYTSRTHELLRALRAGGGDVRAVSRTGYPWDRRDSLRLPEGENTVIDNVDYTHTRTPRNNRFTAVYAAQAATVLERYIKQERIAVVHAASNHVNALPALIAARRLGIPFQYEMRGLWELTRASRQPEFENSHNYTLGLELEGLVASHADRVFVISEQLGHYAREHWKIPAERLHLLPNCVDAERIKPDPAAPILPRSIGYAGSLIAYEGLDTLIEAVSLLVRKDHDVRLHIMGDGEARPALEAQVAALGLGEYVRFYGKMPPEDARARLGRCALACIPRRDFAVCRIVPPLKPAEAQALGKAVVVPDLPVFRDELGPEPAGWFFRSGDAEHLATVLNQALADPERLAATGARGRRHVLQSRQWRQFTDSILFSGQDEA
jgi:glycosyltransferase involved in cell wall biosynthesis